MRPESSGRTLRKDLRAGDTEHAYRSGSLAASRGSAGPDLAGYRGGAGGVRQGGAVVRLMLVGAHACFRQALGVLLDRERGLRMVAQAGTLSGARRVLDDRVDVAVVDTPLPDGSGTDLVGEILALNPEGRVLVLTTGPDPGESVRALEAGACEILDKSVTTARLIAAVRRLAREQGTDDETQKEVR